jgi:hypothetical protein
MEKFNLIESSLVSVEVLSSDLLLEIEGGSFWHDVAWVIGYTAGSFIEYTNAVRESNSQIPYNLRK